MLVQVMRRQKTPQKQDGKASSSADMSSADSMATHVHSLTAVASPMAPSASAPVSAAELPSAAVASTASPAAAANSLVTDGVADSSTKPQTRKSRSRIAANFGALNAQS